MPSTDFENPQIHRFCDLVMKGGVTSGIVYPPVICKLAANYIIKNIGGTSVGAIAAALTAAAEYRRRRFKSGQGYAQLGTLPDFLRQPGALLSLFAADPWADEVLQIALTAIGTETFSEKLRAFVRALLARYVWIPIAAFFVFLMAFLLTPAYIDLPTLLRAVVLAILFGGVAALVSAIAWFAWRAFSVISSNDFGLCHGYRDESMLKPGQIPPLTNWLDAFVMATSGKPANEGPLTFRDLWEAKHPDWHDAPATERCIDFSMITTCLTLGRPFRVPFEADEIFSHHSDDSTDPNAADPGQRPTLYFRVSEFAKLFPPRIVDHMKAQGKVTTVATDAPGDYYRFPAPGDVPILVAARLSMSFPVLFCAVPLYALDAEGVMQRLWFSDGGLTSNFPIHFFDNPLPRWPTFAIDLLQGQPVQQAERDKSAQARFAASAALKHYASDQVFIEGDVPTGTVNPWNRIDRGNALANVLGFASSILDAARNWQDATLTTLPANASRTVGVRLSDQEGGLNLKMSDTQIGDLLKLGEQAGNVLVQRFAQGGDDPPGWRDHRWLRYTAIMGAATRWLTGYQNGYAPFSEMPAQVSYEDLIREHEPDFLSATKDLDSVPILDKFYRTEPKPIAVLPTRPVV